MKENLEIASSVYRTRRGLLRVDPGLALNAQKHVIRRSTRRPRDCDDWLNNSGAALIACCYIDALGKVLGKGKKPKKGENLRRFRRFVKSHMPDLVTECRRKGRRFSVTTLYKTYRCGFVHQFAEKHAIWGRRGPTRPYWFQRHGRPGINIDRLVRGTIAGIEDFGRKFPVSRMGGKTPYENFERWLGN